MVGQTSRLFVVGLNPPETSGSRTLARTELARQLLGLDAVDLGNLFALRTRSAVELPDVACQQDGWLSARAGLIDGLSRADGVLLGYGVQAPTGVAGDHFRSQVIWLEFALRSIELPVWLVGGAPRHPSRWQRYTHRMTPDKPFRDALREALALR
jgi:hypothetical protein